MRIWINGCFDVLHIGHIELLEHAKKLGGYVLVGLDSDERVKELKGDDRPINPIEHRIKMIESLKFVDDVVTFNTDDDLRDIIYIYQPDIILIGDEYKNKEIIGAEYARDVVFFEKKNDISTTKILNKNKQNGK
jgi:D-beta-D-heptose 7-phosphate kinase/D-beta-D-heptose 1-phosphate adenosyltransferase